MENNFPAENRIGDIIIYQSKDGDTKIDVRFEDETVWLTQTQLCELYQSSKANVSEHIKNIFEEGELDESSVVRKIRTTATDGKSYAVNHYMYMSDYVENLDRILTSTGEALLTDAGKISHTQAIEKAKAEYKKYQVQALSPVEEDYMRMIRTIEKTAKDGSTAG